jgi:hypothetical protein
VQFALVPIRSQPNVNFRRLESVIAQIDLNQSNVETDIAGFELTSGKRTSGDISFADLDQSVSCRRTTQRWIAGRGADKQAKMISPPGSVHLHRDLCRSVRRYPIGQSARIDNDVTHVSQLMTKSRKQVLSAKANE